MLNLRPNDLFAERYRLRKQLGRGGFSEVWLAHNETAGFEQAIKIYTGMDERGSRLFRKEFARVYHLMHPRLLRATHFSVDEGRPYLVMPYCRRGSALSLAGRLEEREIARVMRDVGGALAYMHQPVYNLVHRDIKPDNIMLSDQGDYLLSDFGISSELRNELHRSADEQGHTTSDDAGMPPLAYRPPECFARKDEEKGEAVMASDIWAFGATLYELAAGRPPFGDVGGGAQYADPEPPELPAPFSWPLSNILKHCMAKNPWERPSAEELSRMADEYLKKGQWPSRYFGNKTPGRKARVSVERWAERFSGKLSFAAFVLLGIFLAVLVGILSWPETDENIGMAPQNGPGRERSMPANEMIEEERLPAPINKPVSQVVPENETGGQAGQVALENENNKQQPAAATRPPEEPDSGPAARQQGNPAPREVAGADETFEKKKRQESRPAPAKDGAAQALRPRYSPEARKWGYVDKKGDWILYPQFEEAGAFKDGKAKVVKMLGTGELKPYLLDTVGRLAPIPEAVPVEKEVN